MTKGQHNKLFFFCVLLISICFSKVHSQTSSVDTLKSNNDAESIDEQITYSAEDSIVALPGQGRALLYGKSKVEYGSMNIQSEIMEIDYSKNTVVAYGKKDSLGHLFGNPVFKDGADPLEAEKIMYNLKTKRGKIYSAFTKQGELLVFGNEIKKDSNNVTYFKDMKCLPCQDKDARTAFIATKAKVIPNDKIVTGPMYLSIAGVPTPLGLPFGFFPNTKKQHNGILLPQYGYSEVQGFFLKEGGFYWGINDKTNMIVKGDFYTNGSWALNTTNNYNVLYKASGSTYFGYKQFNNGDKDIPKKFSVLKGYEIRWMHNQDNKSNPSIRFSSNVNFVKNQSVNRLNTLDAGAYLQNTFLSNIVFTKTFKRSSLSINGSHIQSVQRDYVEINLPSVTYNINRFFPFKREDQANQNALDKLGISYLVEFKNQINGTEANIFEGNILDKMNYGLHQSIPISTNFNLFKYITATPQLDINTYSYTKWTKKEWGVTGFRNSSVLAPISDINPTPPPGIFGQETDMVDYSREKVIVPVYGINSSTKRDFVTAYDARFSTGFSSKIYFDYLFRKGKIKQIRHLLIPTLSYQYHPDFAASQYGFYRNVQSDTLGRITKYSIYENGIVSGPSAGKLNGLAINLNNVVDAKYNVKSDTGLTSKKVSLLQGVGITTQYNFAADSFKMSNINISARTVILKYLNVVINSNLDPYVYDNYKKRRVDKFTIDKQSKIGRFVNGNLSLNTSINNGSFKKQGGNEKKTETIKNTQVEEEIQWSMNFNYILTLTNLDNTTILPDHKLSAGAGISPTKFWKIAITSGFDFSRQQMSYTTFEIYRDLKCWQANVSWVPFGPNKLYRISLNLKTAMLSDFKIPKQKQWFDNF